jgi:CheY-like chemotaxis protein
LTASALDEDVSRIFAAGIDMHLSKPVKKETLINTISKLSVARVTAHQRKIESYRQE